MNVEVLVSTMNQTDHRLLEKMNINSDAIIINQCDKNKIEEFDFNGHQIKFLSFAERGVGLSRNNALMRATADISLFADDDVRYIDNYIDIITSEFRNNTDADIIIFNVPSTNKERPGTVIDRKKRIRFFNCFRYGTFKIAVRTEKIKKLNIYFSLLFGGGAQYGSGEDSLFLVECLKKGLKIYASPKKIGTVSHDESTWFKGYNSKYFYDRGALFRAIGGRRFSYLLMIQFLIRKRKLYSNNIGFFNALNQMVKGRNEFIG